MTILSAFFLPVCGILGLLLHDPALNAAPEISEGLSLLQHRGQDACGIITGGPRGRLYQCKANGMVRDVFTQEAIARLIGGMGIGHGEHTRFTTTSGHFPSWMNERVWLNESGVYTVSFCGVSLHFAFAQIPMPPHWFRVQITHVMSPFQSVIQPLAARTMRRLNRSTSIPRMA